jgi:hypothetical protein
MVLVMPLIDNTAFELAVTNISTLGDTDVFPFPIENHVLHDRKEEVVRLLQDMSTNFATSLATRGPVNHSGLAPLGYNGFRWATQIDPIWNAYFLGLVLSLAERIEERRVPMAEKVVFSHRFAPSEHHLFERQAWIEFQAESVIRASAAKHVVSVDIADFYGRVYHHRIENQLKYIDSEGERARQIVQLLSAFSTRVSYGLPVGGPAARIISELVLDSVDRVLLAQRPRFNFIRYADDYRFFVDDLEEAYRAIGFLSEKLQRNEGLSLQRLKTRIMTNVEFVSTNTSEPTPGSAAKFLSLHLYYDPYSPTAEDDYEQLTEQLAEFDVLGLLRTELQKGRIDQALTRRLVAALKLMQTIPKEQAVASLLENVETLAPVLPQVLRAVRDNVDDLSEDAQRSVHARVRELIESGHHVAQVDVNLAYMVQILARRHERESADLLMHLFQSPHGHTSTPSPNIQRDIVLALGRWRTEYWLHDLKPHYATLHPWVARAFYVASFAMGDEGHHWRRGVRSSLSPFDSVVAEWASERHGNPGWEIPK